MPKKYMKNVWLSMVICLMINISFKLSSDIKLDYANYLINSTLRKVQELTSSIRIKPLIMKVKTPWMIYSYILLT